jgi:bifunctional non-homologous end joining protein LigD
MARRYPELVPLGQMLRGHAVILDGEIITFNDDGRPDFGVLQGRMHLNDSQAITQWARTRPATWALYDPAAPR